MLTQIEIFQKVNESAAYVPAESLENRRLKVADEIWVNHNFQLPFGKMIDADVIWTRDGCAPNGRTRCLYRRVTYSEGKIGYFRIVFEGDSTKIYGVFSSIGFSWQYLDNGKWLNYPGETNYNSITGKRWTPDTEEV